MSKPSEVQVLSLLSHICWSQTDKWRCETRHPEDHSNWQYSSTHRCGRLTVTIGDGELFEQIHSKLQWVNSPSQNSTPQWCRLVWVRGPRKSFQAVEAGHYSRTSIEVLVLWCEEKWYTHRWCITEWIRRSLSSGRRTCSICFKIFHSWRNKICTNWEIAPNCLICMQQILWLYVWQKCDCRNWSSTIDYHIQVITEVLSR